MKEFLKPTWVKIGLSIVLLIPLFLITEAVRTVFGTCKVFLPFCVYRDCAGFPARGEYVCAQGIDVQGIIANIALYVIAYVVSAALIAAGKSVFRKANFK
jgi:hypothetical protein